ncbi:aldose epimerase family protein [[Clostridium] hylemonae]|uniref:Aldose 1-epimerase n=1 Tax=[Clostridium] hylemonae DSM 15053 TaxID=553973 RepID=C0BY97_9FIRM|nr:aldose epimerase family protein [[Clostridium] hylemonae]EEG74825.1 aldose 1-epimerase [[Clostridium] hylemonae DSM 15053]QEK18186.1 Aldose 1-epimerase [[Clostridium] hylemonae DSM 15053]
MVRDFGTTEAGEQASVYELRNKNGMTVCISDYGAAVVSVRIPCRDGQVRDVVLGYDCARDYEAGGQSFGGTVGRVANRIGGARFTLNGKTYTLAENDNGNNLHSGPDTYNHRLWEVREADERHVALHLSSPDKDQGYPGALDVTVTYSLNGENALEIRYEAAAEADTIVNLTNHSYFNLNGHDSGDILEQELWLDAEAYTRADEESIPTGEIVSVEGTPMDFRVRKTIGRDIGADYEALDFAGGYDHNWVLGGDGFRRTGEFSCRESGIRMQIFTDLPGMQVYSGNFLDRERGKAGAVYGKHQGICFETQYFPDAVNKDNFESPVVRAGGQFESVTSYKFEF